MTKYAHFKAEAVELRENKLIQQAFVKRQKGMGWITDMSWKYCKEQHQDAYDPQKSKAHI